jgi:hypothetical protein
LQQRGGTAEASGHEADRRAPMDFQVYKKLATLKIEKPNLQSFTNYANFSEDRMNKGEQLSF